MVVFPFTSLVALRTVDRGTVGRCWNSLAVAGLCSFLGSPMKQQHTMKTQLCARYTQAQHVFRKYLVVSMEACIVLWNGMIAPSIMPERPRLRGAAGGGIYPTIITEDVL